MTPTQHRVTSRLGRLAIPAPPELVVRVLSNLDLGDYCTTVDAPYGPVFVAYSKRGISMSCPAAVIGGEVERFVEDFRRHFQRPLFPGRADPVLQSAVRSGNTARLAYDLIESSPFTRSVLQATLDIPCGEVRTYGWVARKIGKKGAARAVGSALNTNPIPVLIPCHRVVRSDGSIGGYAYGPDVKLAMLAAEGTSLPGGGGKGSHERF